MWTVPQLPFVPKTIILMHILITEKLHLKPPRKTGKRSRNVQLRIDDLVWRANGNPAPLGPWLETRPRFRRRVGVIDSAETLNPQAANAFLKFLEEPPSYTVIILIAPSPQAVLPHHHLSQYARALRNGERNFRDTYPAPDGAARTRRRLSERG